MYCGCSFFFFDELGPKLGMNCRYYSGYKPEDFIGRMSVVCQAGNNANLELVGLTRFYLGLLRLNSNQF